MMMSGFFLSGQFQPSLAVAGDSNRETIGGKFGFIHGADHGIVLYH